MSDPAAPKPDGPTTSSPPKPLDQRSSAHGVRSRARRDQVVAVALGVILLGGAFLVQQASLAPRRKELVKESETSLQSLLVVFPRLTLGGFRGLFATVLWIQSENDKNDRKWEQLETKYDIIGDLQPYFVSVYVFHAWNQAYNLSAQWHDEDVKYKWVLDGLAYLYRGEDYNPGNADILNEQGHMYFLKLGGAYERIFYRAHWRADIARFYQYNDSRLRENAQAVDALKLVHEFVMRVGPENRDAAAAAIKAGDFAQLQKLDEYHTAELDDPSGLTNRKGFGISILDPFLFEKRTDGLAADKPMEFRYGVSPFYFAYATYNRTIKAGWPTTVAPRVVASWPAMSLRMWCRDDLYYSQQCVLELFGPDGILEHANVTDKGLMDRIAERETELRDCHRNVALIGPKALDVFGTYLLKFPTERFIHKKHMLETTQYIAQSKAELTLLNALIDWQANKRTLDSENKIKTEFESALPLYDDAIEKAETWVNEIYPIVVGAPYAADRQDSEKYVTALRDRKRGIENLLKTPAGQKADMSFLKEETVER